MRPGPAFDGVASAAGPVQIAIRSNKSGEKVSRTKMITLACFAAAEEKLVPPAVRALKAKVSAQILPVRFIGILRRNVGGALEDHTPAFGSACTAARSASNLTAVSSSRAVMLCTSGDCASLRLRASSTSRRRCFCTGDSVSSSSASTSAWYSASRPCSEVAPTRRRALCRLGLLLAAGPAYPAA